MRASKVEAGAHHACRLLLQALFIIAKTLPVVSTKAAASTINKGVFIARSHCARAAKTLPLSPIEVRMNSG